MARAPLLIGVLLLAACSLPGDARTFTAGDVTIVDASGLVTGARDGAPDPGTDERPVIVSPGDLTEIAVHWTGSSCVEGWRVRLPDGNRLRVEIEPAGDVSEPCAATPTAHSVILELNRVVQADAIEVEQLGGS